MNQQILSISRTWTLMRHDIQINKKSLISAFGAIAGVSVGLFLIATLTSDNQVGFHESLFVNILMVGGFVASSVACSELHDKPKGLHYLMLPGSSLEKFVAKLLLTGIGWAIAATVVYILATIVGTLIVAPFGASNPGIFVPIGRELWQAIALYLVTQSIFLFGSIYFKKAAFFKTILLVGIAAFVLGFWYAMAGRVIFHEAFVGFGQPVGPIEEIFAPGPGFESLVGTFDVVGNIFLWAVTPIFFWIAGYLRLRETEV
ncbi:MAG: hypothetical protein ACLFP4_02805 [Spirochaetales bacterium]